MTNTEAKEKLNSLKYGIKDLPDEVKSLFAELIDVIGLSVNRIGEINIAPIIPKGVAAGQRAGAEAGMWMDYQLMEQHYIGIENINKHVSRVEISFEVKHYKMLEVMKKFIDLYKETTGWK